MSVSGIIFSNTHDNNVSELTRMRSMGSVPFGCRYRLIDFALSNMVNSGITEIRVIINKNYRSLIDHLGSGKDWDLARRTGGLSILPPFITSYDTASDTLFHTRLEALKGIVSAISHIKSDYVVLSDCDIICNIDLSEVVSFHEKNSADITVVTKETFFEGNVENADIVIGDENCNITDIMVNPKNLVGVYNLLTNIIVANTDYLKAAVADAIAHGYSSFTKDVLLRNIGKSEIKMFNYKGVFKNVYSLEEYYACNMDLISNREFRDALFGVKDRPILTKVRNSPPTRYIDGCNIQNSLIADGCTIEGHVENSILFRGVRVGKNTVIKNSILYQDTYTGDNVLLNCVIADKNTVVRDGVMLSGHSTLPFFIEKGKMI